jgi:phosphoglycerate dehydrogenase-like enzyme
VTDPERRPQPVVVVTGASEHAPPPGIDDAGAAVDLRFATDEAGERAALPDADAMFLWGGSRAALEDSWERATRLRWIQVASAGVDWVLFPALIESDVVLTNARGVFDDAVAEWAIAAMLAFGAGLRRSIADQRSKTWNRDRRTERMVGARLVVVGPGPIGRAAATRALRLGMSVTMVGRAPRTDETFGDVLGRERLHDALRDADHVLNALPLTDTTRRMFDRAAFEAMPPTARFYNVGRGGTVDEAALVDALASGTIAGAALDVFEVEPLPQDSPLWTMPNVIVSPHIAGDFEGWERAAVGVFVDNAARWTKGEPLVNVVDKRAGYGGSR